MEKYNKMKQTLILENTFTVKRIYNKVDKRKFENLAIRKKQRMLSRLNLVLQNKYSRKN